MPPTLAALGIDKMSVADRIELAELIWESVHAERKGSHLTPEVIAELERRADEHDADPDGGIPWEVVEREARARWGK